MLEGNLDFIRLRQVRLDSVAMEKYDIADCTTKVGFIRWSDKKVILFFWLIHQKYDCTIKTKPL